MAINPLEYYSASTFHYEDSGVDGLIFRMMHHNGQFGGAQPIQPVIQPPNNLPFDVIDRMNNLQRENESLNRQLQNQVMQSVLLLADHKETAIMASHNHHSNIVLAIEKVSELDVMIRQIKRKFRQYFPPAPTILEHEDSESSRCSTPTMEDEEEEEDNA